MKWTKILTKEFLIEQYMDLRKSMQEIADIIKTNKHIIRYYLNKFNIPIRTISEAKKGSKHTEETRQKMSDAKKGDKSYNFKGKIKNDVGYWLVYMPNHPYKNNKNYVRESRLVIEFQIGRYLDPKWNVHHINGIRDDNRIENLMCFISNSAHRRFHGNPKNVKESEIIFDGRKIKERNEGN